MYLARFRQALFRHIVRSDSYIDELPPHNFAPHIHSISERALSKYLPFLKRMLLYSSKVLSSSYAIAIPSRCARCLYPYRCPVLTVLEPSAKATLIMPYILFLIVFLIICYYPFSCRKTFRALQAKTAHIAYCSHAFLSTLPREREQSSITFRLY